MKENSLIIDDKKILNSQQNLMFKFSKNVVVDHHYRDCLGFKDFKNFDGVRLAYKGVRIVAFKLKEAIAVDNLISMQFFDYKRRVKKNNVIVEQVIKCKIKGLRSDGLKEYLERKNVRTEVQVMEQH